jgi:hydroxyacylglutathione hydrolase
VLFRQFVDDDLGCASYLVGDEEAGEAVVVDPAYEIDQYLEEANRRDVRIVRVLETHTHADHVAGHGRFALEHGTPVAIHPGAEPEYEFEPLADGRVLEVGAVAITVLHTPGHRPEHCCFSVADRSRSEEPWLVLTGDSLLVGDAARPDLAVASREGAEGLFHSLGHLLELGDGVEVYPGHVAGSLCGAGLSSKQSSTIGYERRSNPALAASDVAEFVAGRLNVATPPPPNMERIVELNRGPFLGAPERVGPVELSDGGVLVDVRPAREFGAGHVPGAVNVPANSSGFGTRAAFVLDFGSPIVVQARSPEEAEAAARKLRAVGLLDLVGYVVDPGASQQTEPVSLDELARLLERDEVVLVDVREKDERDAGYIPGSLHVPYRQSRARADDLRDRKPIVTICESGSRATVAASVLAAEGVAARPVLGAGVADWRHAGRPVVEFRRCGS